MGKKFKTVLAYGAVLSLPMILMSVMAYVFNITESKSFGWISFVVFAASVVLVQLHYRKNFYEGFASYGKMLGGTVLMLIVAALILLVYTFVFYKFVAPEMLTQMLDLAIVKMEEQQQGLSSSDINKASEYMKNYVFTPAAMSLMTLFTSFFQGLLVSLISSIFTRKNADAFTEAMRDIDNE